jgi:hypothetical protein
MGIFASVLLTFAAVTVPVRQIILPGIAGAVSLRSFMAGVREVIGSEDLSFFRVFDYGAVFYRQGHIATYEGPWPAGAPGYVLMSQAEWERTRGPARAYYEQVPILSDGNRRGPDSLVLVRRGREQELLPRE